MTVTLQRDVPVAIVTIDNPPVNATSQSVRAGLMTVLEQIDADAGIKTVILAGAGRTFVAGGDIKEFSAPPVPPHLPDVLNAMEASAKPWIAALNGTALGGGLEMSMACHMRIATPETQLGLPEVNLGLIPGAGGTVRLPRLIDPTEALTMIASGKPISASHALRLGLIDKMSDDPVQAAKDLASKAVTTRTLQRAVRPVDQTSFDAVKARLHKKARGQISVGAAIRSVERAMTLPAQLALDAERAAFLELKASEQSAALRHVFFAERATLADPRCNGPSRDIASVGVIGGGTMGAGIATAFLRAGYPVHMVEREAGAVGTARKRVQDILEQGRKRGLLAQVQLDSMHNRFRASDRYGDLDEVDLVVEAVFEDIAVKRGVFAQLDEVTKPRAILATNTSYLDVNQIAGAVADPARVIGLHFFSPAHIMKLLEIVTPDKVADDVIATAAKLAKRLGKIGVLAGVCDGFIGNRIMSSYRHEADVLLLEGALPWEVDAAMREYGFAMGIYEMQDMAGLDIAWATRARRAETAPRDDGYVTVADSLCENGWFGRKTDKGWHDYADGQAIPSKDTAKIIAEAREMKGVSPRPLTPDQIMDRILSRLRMEADQVLADGVARQPSDIDVVMINGYGFPRWRGGPFFTAK
ncbi:MAG: 3-hydroxyacyl-CoA dehydrogenase NAD-binding domain-containing protein [Boseongicola sp.]|nr:3-hydroxyacyl-CoA dehydrogenase NAD-binding domain-containing protein [Boseongicola sp.]